MPLPLLVGIAAATAIGGTILARKSNETSSGGGDSDNESEVRAKAKAERLAKERTEKLKQIQSSLTKEIKHTGKLLQTELVTTLSIEPFDDDKKIWHNQIKLKKHQSTLPPLISKAQASKDSLAQEFEFFIPNLDEAFVRDVQVAQIIYNIKPKLNPEVALLVATHKALIQEISELDALILKIGNEETNHD